MTSKTVAQLLADLGVQQSHSRPHQSTDNPYSEANFKTLKYSPTFPKRFTGIDHARAFCDSYFPHHNHQHRHSGIGLHPPSDVHHGHAEEIRARRQAVLDAAYAARPERFRRPPSAPRIPEATWINRPKETPLTAQAI
jgi:putative transposase